MEKPDFSAFAQYIPGFDFLQKLAGQAADSVTPGLQSASGAIPGLGSWVAPTFSVEELDKRIQDLRAVHFWLDQNTKALGATIQALEVQKMTLATLKGMNLSLQDVAESFKIKPEQVQAKEPPKPSFSWGSEPPKAAPEASAAQPEQQEAAKPAVDPMQWWGSLTEQFTAIATGALQDMAGQAAKAAEQMAQTVQAGTAAAEQMAAQASEGAAAQSASEPAAKRRTRSAATQAAPTRARAPRSKPAAPAKSRQPGDGR
ncbi:MAG: hypothetical protein RJA36_3605 [Pseudomonadota bacterium]|jgi:hypothetical protein